MCGWNWWDGNRIKYRLKPIIREIRIEIVVPSHFFFLARSTKPKVRSARLYSFAIPIRIRTLNYLAFYSWDTGTVSVIVMYTQYPIFYLSFPLDDLYTYPPILTCADNRRSYQEQEKSATILDQHSRQTRRSYFALSDRCLYYLEH